VIVEGRNARPAYREDFILIARRTLVFAGISTLLAVPSLSAAWAATEAPFSSDAFQKAQAAGRPILVKVHASWCSTCRAQEPIVGELTKQAKFMDLAIFRLDFDSQKADAKRLGAQMQSTLIVFKGAKETGRSVGDTKRDSIAALLDTAV
jgi:thiol-disulfide isomerase/thioredoxin